MGEKRFTVYTVVFNPTPGEHSEHGEYDTENECYEHIRKSALKMTWFIVKKKGGGYALHEVISKPSVKSSDIL